MVREVVPGDHDGLGDQGERHGALHGAGQPVAGLAGAGDGVSVAEGDFDGPPCSAAAGLRIVAAAKSGYAGQ